MGGCDPPNPELGGGVGVLAETRPEASLLSGLSTAKLHNIRSELIGKPATLSQILYPTRFMQEFLRTTPAQAVIWTTVLISLVFVGVFVVQRFRDRTGDGRLSANDMLTNFREMQHEGDIEETEFRTIKTVLGEKLQDEINGADDEG